jgi:hypothetical protein
MSKKIQVLIFFRVCGRMTEQDAVESLVALGNSVTLVRCSTSATRTKDLSTPEKSFKAAGYKRVRENLIHVMYESEEGDVMAVPLAKGENLDVFNARRQKTADMMFDPTRKTAYCQFKNIRQSTLQYKTHVGYFFVRLCSRSATIT